MFLGFSLEPESETFRSLLGMTPSIAWESVAIETLYDVEEQNEVGFDYFFKEDV